MAFEHEDPSAGLDFLADHPGLAVGSRVRQSTVYFAIERLLSGTSPGLRLTTSLVISLKSRLL